jgi:hypothetical protein
MHRFVTVSCKKKELFYQTSSSFNDGQDYFSLAAKYSWLFSVKDKVQTSTSLTNIHKTRNLYITGHLDGTISFWDASCPLFLQILP